MSKKHFRYRQRTELLANKEQRTGKILKAFRVVDDEQSDMLNGILIDWVREGELPPINNYPNVHTAFVLDPRLTGKSFNNGFVAGAAAAFSIARRNLEEHERESDHEVDARIGAIKFARNRKMFMAELESEKLLDERQAIYEALGDAGIRGFLPGNARKKQRITPPTIVLGTLQSPLSYDQEAQFADTLGTAFDAHGMTSLSLGKLVIKGYQP